MVLLFVFACHASTFHLERWHLCLSSISTSSSITRRITVSLPCWWWFNLGSSQWSTAGFVYCPYTVHKNSQACLTGFLFQCCCASDGGSSTLKQGCLCVQALLKYRWLHMRHPRIKHAFGGCLWIFLLVKSEMLCSVEPVWERGDLTLRSLLRSLICACEDGTGSCYSF